MYEWKLDRPGKNKTADSLCQLGRQAEGLRKHNGGTGVRGNNLETFEEIRVCSFAPETKCISFSFINE